MDLKHYTEAEEESKQVEIRMMLNDQPLLDALTPQGRHDKTSSSPPVTVGEAEAQRPSAAAKSAAPSPTLHLGASTTASTINKSSTQKTGIKETPAVTIKDSFSWSNISSGSSSNSNTNSNKPLLQKMNSATNRRSPTCATEELIVMGGVLREFGKHRDADECYDKAAKVCRENNGGDSGDQEPLLGAMGIHSTSSAFSNNNINKASLEALGSFGIAKSRSSHVLLESSDSNNKACIALMNLASLSVKCGKLEEARDLYSQALEEHYNVEGNNPQTALVADIWVRLGRLAAREKRHDEALCYFEKALEIKVRVYGGAGGEHPYPQNDDLATTLECLGHITSNLQKYQDSLKYYKESLKMYYAIHGSVGEQQQNKRHHLKVIAAKLDTLGRISHVLGEYDAACIFYHEALMLKGDLYGATTHSIDICRSLDALGNLHRILGDYENARKYFMRELCMLYGLHGGRQAQTKEIAVVLHNLGNLHCNLNRFPEADGYYKQALSMKYHCFGKEAQNMSLATTLHSLGILSSELGKYGDAETYFHRALEMKYHVYGKDANNTNIANTINSLGNLARNRGQYVKARDYYDQAIAMDRKAAGNNGVRNENHAKTILNRGNMSMKLGRLKEARQWLEHALAMFYELYGGEDAKNIDIAVVLCSLANLLRCQKEYSESTKYYLRALEMQYQLFGQDARNANIAETLNNLGILYRDQKQYDMAKTYHQQALQMMVGTMGTDSSGHPLVQKIAHELIKIEQTCARYQAFDGGEESARGKCWMMPNLGGGYNRSRRASSSSGKLF